MQDTDLILIRIYRRWLIRKSDWVYRLALLPTAPSVVAFGHYSIPIVFNLPDNSTGLPLITALSLAIFLGVGGGLFYASYIHLFSLIANLIDHFQRRSA